MTSGSEVAGPRVQKILVLSIGKEQFEAVRRKQYLFKVASRSRYEQDTRKALIPRNLKGYPRVWWFVSSFYGAYVRLDFFLDFGPEWQLVESNIGTG